MDALPAMQLWSNACQHWDSETPGNLTALGGAALVSGAPLYSLHTSTTDRDKVSAFLREWARAIDDYEEPLRRESHGSAH